MKQLEIQFIEDEDVEIVDIEKVREQIKNKSAIPFFEHLARTALTSKNSQVLKLYAQLVFGWVEKTGFEVSKSDESEFDWSKVSSEEKATALKILKKARKAE